MNRKVLILGGGGFIGSEIAKILSKRTDPSLYVKFKTLLFTCVFTEYEVKNIFLNISLSDIFIFTGDVRSKLFLFIKKFLDLESLVSKTAFMFNFVGSALYPTVTSEEYITPP